MEELKKNAEKARVSQTLDSITKYIHEISDSCDHRLKWSIRCDVLEQITIMSYFGLLILCISLNVSDAVRDNATDAMFFVVLMAIIRSWKANRLWREKEGEWTGATNVLRLLGMLPPEDGGRERKKRRTWNEGVEMVKSWAAEKKAKMNKGFATT